MASSRGSNQRRRDRTECRAFERAATEGEALEELAEEIRGLGGRALLLGAPGTGKSALAVRLGLALARRGPAPCCLGADPGSPGFGVPGAVCLGTWRDGGWHLLRVEALCTLDAGRFRLPLSACVRRLVPRTRESPLLVDGPGVVRGVAGAELLSALVEANDIDVVLAIERAGRQFLLAAELEALGLPVMAIAAPERARRPTKAARARNRTRLWDAYLEGAGIHRLELEATPILGTPPPLEVVGQWRGRQAALISPDGTTAALAEVQELAEGALRLRCHRAPEPGHALLVRDARREANGTLGTAGPDAADVVRYVAPGDVLPGAPSPTGPRPVVRVGPTTATDLADTEANRRALARLGEGAHTLFLEASFRLGDAEQARRTGHLTTRACGEIAERAGAERLVPFHFSRRYEDDLSGPYDEVRAAFSRTITPPLRDGGE